MVALGWVKTGQSSHYPPSMVLLPGAWSQPASHLQTAAPPALTSQVVWTPQGVGEHWPDTRETRTVTSSQQAVSRAILVGYQGTNM